jgi:hypothetical protein
VEEEESLPLSSLPLSLALSLPPISSASLAAPPLPPLRHCWLHTCTYCRLSFFSVFDQTVTATWCSSPPLYIESPVRRFCDQEACDGPAVPTESIPKRCTA